MGGHNLSKLLRDEPVIIMVVTNPKPSDRVCFPNAEGSVSAANTNRPNVFCRVDTLEMQGGVERVLSPQAICSSGVALGCLTQLVISVPKGRQNVGFHRRSWFRGSAIPDEISCLAIRALLAN